jgi:hypothetical protein
MLMESRVTAPDETDVDELKKVPVPQGLSIEILDFGDE